MLCLYVFYEPWQKLVLYSIEKSSGLNVHFSQYHLSLFYPFVRMCSTSKMSAFLSEYKNVYDKIVCVFIFLTVSLW